MPTQVAAYYRPETLADALLRLAQPDTVVLAGGTRLIADPPDEPSTVVDLQSLPLNEIVVGGETITLGAMARLQTLVDHAALPPLIRAAAQREGPNTLRHLATVGGAVVTADWESELYAALLVHEATVTQATAAGPSTTPLAEFSPAAGTVVTAVTIAAGGQTAAARVARTPADSPIVAVVGRHAGDVTRLAVCGVAARPLLVPPGALGDVDPPADFRGSANYRRRMAQTLGRRVLAALAAAQAAAQAGAE